MIVSLIPHTLHFGNDHFTLTLNNIGCTRQLTTCYFGFSSAFDNFQLTKFTRRNKGHSNTSITCTAGTSNTMNIAFRILRNIKIDNMSNIINIYAAGSDVRSDKNISCSVTEFLHNTITLSLA